MQAPVSVPRAVPAVEHLADSDADGEAVEVEVSFHKPPYHSAATATATTAVGNSGSRPRGSREHSAESTSVVKITNEAVCPPPSPEQRLAQQQQQRYHYALAESTGLVPPTSAPFIPAVDYADRERLLLHITHLSMQLQRAQLQLEAHARTIAILQPAAAAVAAQNQRQQQQHPAGSTENEGTSPPSRQSSVPVNTSATLTLALAGPPESVTAAVVAARTEQDLHRALSSTLALFDPIVAEETVHRLDGALVQLSLLREAELGRLEQSETELQRLRGGWLAITSRLDELTIAKETLEKENSAMRDSYEAMRLEVDRLRLEETVLVRKVKGLEGLLGEGNLADDIHVVGGRGQGGGAAAGATVPAADASIDSLFGASPRPFSVHFQQQQSALQTAECTARQALMLDMFWEPTCIAFDAGLTWVSESEQLEARRQRRPEQQQLRPLSPLRSGRQVGAEAAAAAAAPLNDAERTLLLTQNETITALEAKLSVCQERQRMARLETDRLRLLYEGEQRRSEALAADHTRQMQLAYDEVLKDRKLIAAQLQSVMKQHMRQSFTDGQRYERQRLARRSSHKDIGRDGGSRGNGNGSEAAEPSLPGEPRRGRGTSTGRGRQPPRMGPTSAGGKAIATRRPIQDRSRPAAAHSSARGTSNESVSTSSSTSWQSPRKRASKKLGRHELKPAAGDGSNGSTASAVPTSMTAMAQPISSSAMVAVGREGSASIRGSLPRTVGTGHTLAGGKHAVIAATLANAELAAAKASSELYYERFKSTDSENERLRGDLAKQEGDALVVIRHLEQQLVAALEDASAFKQNVADRLARQSEAERAVREHYEELLQDRDKSMADLAALVGRLQDDLRQASRYVQQRQEHQQEVLRLRTAMEELVMAHERETAAMRFQSVDRKMKLIALERTMREEFQAMVNEESKRLLEAKHAALQQQNHALEVEKESLVRDMNSLLTLTTTINSERTRFKQISELHKSAHEEVLRHTVARNRQGRDWELKTQRLEARVRALTAKQLETENGLKAAYGGRIKELEDQLAAAHSTCMELRNELRSVRCLAQHVVGQRSDLEKFFYVALEDCRRYRASTIGASARNGAGMALLGASLPAARPPASLTGGSGAAVGSNVIAAPADTFRLTQPTLAEMNRRPVPGTTGAGVSGGSTANAVASLPPMRPARTETQTTGVSTSTASPAPLPGAYIEDLSWEDKEKVIKALLFYINATYYQTPPSAAAN